MRAARTRPGEGRGPTAMDGRRPPGPGAGAARGPADDRPGTGEPGPRGRTRGQARCGAGRGRVASRPKPAERGATGRGRARAAAGTGLPTPSPKGGDPSLPLHPPETNSRGRRTPPTCSWGVRRPRGGQDARPIRPGMGPGREQAPRRPHDAGRPTGALAGTRGPRRPARGGRPLPGDGGPRRAGCPTQPATMAWVQTGPSQAA